MWAMIATWTMALDGVTLGADLLKESGFAGDAIERAIKDVEDGEYYKSVGYGGLPNEQMMVELDAAYMDGDRLDFGAIGAVQDFANPISIARLLSSLPFNNFLVGTGAEEYASKAGFERKVMLTERAKIFYKNRVHKEKNDVLSPYAGHDTVGMLAVDASRHLVGGTSTSGLFMKKKGRVGDSPIIGSGLYVDNRVGGATATGLGEDLIKGVTSFQIVEAMKNGLSAQEACEKVVFELDADLKARRGESGDLSVIAVNNLGEWGCASNIKDFSFVVATEEMEPTVFITNRVGDKMDHQVAPTEWVDAYFAKRQAEVEVQYDND
ncbi:N(4)-(beta-N-acetylglucosaminyl)-L-asparaginase [Fundicoccus sp. Sow4_H7]|uniref:N(4)-(beta-N-acetylglucosaminyl)-L-asparaginase n=1 Tax=Fundicoccus sp. Sow4_H7 TaxID=3438784 RepID=UPI003F918DF0